MSRALHLLTATALTGCYCSFTPAEDAAVPVDAGGAGGADSGLPYVEPRGPACAEADIPAGALCVEEGWFELRRWHTTTVGTAMNEVYPPAPTVPTYIDTYALDQREVSGGEYLAFLRRTGGSPPPPTCGYEDHERELDVLTEMRPELSGWNGTGQPEPGFGELPVVCVTRAEASAYCHAQGGRLPTAAEHMKAGTLPGEPPTTTRFPWGDEPPPEHEPPWPGLEGEWWHLYASIRLPWGPGLLARPPGAAHLGRGPRGFDDLVGNASELLLDCRADLGTVYSGSSPLIRPAPPVRETCAEGFVVAGANWRSLIQHEEVALSQILFVNDDSELSGFVYPTPLGGLQGEGVSSGFFGRSQPEADTPEGQRGPNRRSWRVGFRCAYDL